MAKVAEPGSSVSVKQIHLLLDFEKDGPPVQDLRVARIRYIYNLDHKMS